MELGEYEKAREIYQEVISDIEDKNVVLNAHYQSGIIESNLKNFSESRMHFQYIIANAENKVLISKSYYQKALIYMETGKIKQAKENFINAKDAYPSHSTNLNILAGVFDYLKMHPIDSMEEVIMHEELVIFMFIHFPDFKASFIHSPKEIALYYFSEKEYGKSRRIFQLITEEFSFKKDYCAWAYLMIGETYRFEGFWDLAMQSYSDVEEKCSDQKWLVAWALHRKADILIKTGKSDEAVKIFQDIISRYKMDTIDKYKNNIEGSYDDIVYKSYIEIQKLKDKY